MCLFKRSGRGTEDRTEVLSEFQRTVTFMTTSYCKQWFLFNSYRYEDEINKRTAAENEFVTLKKVRAVV